MKFDSIFSQERPILFLTKMLQKKSISQAMLFTGIDGVGKQTTARALGMAVNCLNPQGVSACGECSSCHKVISGAHPDMIAIKPDGAFIKIGQVRDVSRQLRFAPLEGKWRVVIINDAHVLNLEASNAILKILEEPPERTIIILTASQTTDLLPTIVSRCQRVAFSPIPYEKVAEVLMEVRGLDKQTATILAISTKGSLGKALSVDGKEWTIWRRNLLEQMGSLSTKSIQPVFAFAEAIAGDKDRLGDSLEMIMTWFRDVLMCRISPEKIINKDFVTEIEHEAQGNSIGRLLEKVEAVFAAQQAISKNSNPRLALEVMMFRVLMNT